MSDHPREPQHPKQDFQVERIAFFSDAVFAIAITLLIIEFKPPIILKNTNEGELWAQLRSLEFKFVALLVSFTLIISFWMRHHTLFKHINNYNTPIVIANMALLLPIIFFPFTNAFLYESVNSQNPLFIIPVRLFFVNTIVASAIMYVIYYLVIKKYPECSYPMNSKDQLEFNIQLPLMTISFTLIVLISFASVKWMYMGVLPLALYNFYNKYLKKRLQKRREAKRNRYKKP